MIVTGIQPTGSAHIGNYFGAIKPLIELQKTDADTFVFVADYHAITMGFDPAALYENSTDLGALILACGFDTEKGCLFRQSDVPAHIEMAHILGCTAARVGQLNRMVQFREKMESLGVNGETPSVGLYTYPVLQAADVLLYQDPFGQPTQVPVGADQSQHLNLVIDIAQSFNSRFGQTFTIPEPIVSQTPRIMSLYDGSKKMSKSDPDRMNRIDLLDDPDLIRKKFRKATSDSGFIPGSVEEIGDRRELRNLLAILAASTDRTLASIVVEFEGKGFGHLKAALTDAMIAMLEPIQRAYETTKTIAEDSMATASVSAMIISDETLSTVRERIGITRSR